MRNGMLIWGSVLLLGLFVVGVRVHPVYKRYQQAKSDLRVAELGAHLAFIQNSFYAHKFVFATDFSELEPYVEGELPCVLTPPPFVCMGYKYTLEKEHWIVASSETNPSVYIAFDLANGTVDCSHAPAPLQQAAICSALE